MSFEPKGERAEWQYIYDAIREMDVDEVITYDEIGALLGRPFADNRAPMYRALKELLNVHSRHMVTVRGTGYRMAKASEHADTGMAYHRRSRLQNERAVDVVTNVRRDEMDRHEVARNDQVQRQVAHMAQQQRAFEKKLQAQEAALSLVKSNTAIDEDMMAAAILRSSVWCSLLWARAYATFSSATEGSNPNLSAMAWRRCGRKVPSVSM